jgi:hypothetical protein
MRKAARISGIVALVAATWAWGPVPHASADLDAGSQWGATSRADAMAIEYLNTSAPVFGSEPVIYGTPASAGSLIDSIGQSNAFAAAPYPGDIMVGAADNGNGALVGAGFPGIFQSYPFYVHSEYPLAQDKVQDQSGNRLVAHSEQYASSSKATSGLITGDFLSAFEAQASSGTAVDSTTGQLTALADSRLDAFKLTDKLQIGKSTAHAKITKLPGQAPVKESSFTLGSIIVNGVEMSYSDQGFKFGDQKEQSPGDPKPLFDALKAAGITVEILPAASTPTSIDSAGMKITQVFDYKSGKQRISFIIGRVSASIRGEAKPAAGDSLLDGFPASGGGQSSTVTDSSPTTPEPASAAADSATPSQRPDTAGISEITAPSAGTPDLSLNYPAGASAAATPPPVVGAISDATSKLGARTQQAAPEVRLATPASVGKGLRDDDISGFYVGLGALGALLVAGVLLLRAGRKAALAAASGGSVLKLPGT